MANRSLRARIARLERQQPLEDKICVLLGAYTCPEGYNFRDAIADEDLLEQSNSKKQTSLEEKVEERRARIRLAQWQQTQECKDRRTIQKFIFEKRKTEEGLRGRFTPEDQARCDELLALYPDAILQHKIDDVFMDLIRIGRNGTRPA